MKSKNELTDLERSIRRAKNLILILDPWSTGASWGTFGANRIFMIFSLFQEKT